MIGAHYRVFTAEKRRHGVCGSTCQICGWSHDCGRAVMAAGSGGSRQPGKAIHASSRSGSGSVRGNGGHSLCGVVAVGRVSADCEPTGSAARVRGQHRRHGAVSEAGRSEQSVAHRRSWRRRRSRRTDTRCRGHLSMYAGRLLHNGQAVDVDVWHCESFLERALGLMGQAPLPNALALRIARCRGIHTFGLGYAIDAVFTDRDGRVLRCRRALPPRSVVLQPGAHAAWEMRAGLAGVLGVEAGSTLMLEGELLEGESRPAPLNQRRPARASGSRGRSGR